MTPNVVATLECGYAFRLMFHSANKNRYAQIISGYIPVYSPLKERKHWDDPADICLLKVNNKNTGTRCEIFSKLTIKTPEQCQKHCSSVFIVNLKHISHIIVVFIVNFEHVIASWGNGLRQTYPIICYSSYVLGTTSAKQQKH